MGAGGWGGGGGTEGPQSSQIVWGAKPRYLFFKGQKQRIIGMYRHVKYPNCSLRTHTPLPPLVIFTKTNFGRKLSYLTLTFRLPTAAFFKTNVHYKNRSAPQVANLGGHPVQPPFKIRESIIYYFLVTSDMRISLNIYVHLNVTKRDRHFFV